MSRYAESGVDISAGQRAVERMGLAVRATHGPEVLSGPANFGGLFEISNLVGLRRPVLVASTDGVGTKVMLAEQADRFEGIGQDIVNHCCNDILVQGARPLFFLDYLAASKLDPAKLSRVVEGMSVACRAAGCAILGGETAEMPGVYCPGQFDVAGTIVGVVEYDHLLPRPTLAPGDQLVGLASSGPHTNGYSLIRKVFGGIGLDTIFREVGVPLADALLAPHRAYLHLHPHLHLVKALAHLTGGGFLENLPRVLPEGLGVRLQRGSWPIPPLFSLIAERGQVGEQEMHRVFNMGIGMVAILAPDQVASFRDAVGEETWVIGELHSGAGVELI